MKYLVLLLLFCSNFLFAIEGKYYESPYSEILGLYQDADGSVYTSSPSGFFKMNLENEESNKLHSYYGGMYTKKVFKYNGEIYFHNGQVLYVYRNDSVHVHERGIIDSYVKGNKLYLLKSKDPRIEVIEDGNSKTFSLGDNTGYELYNGFAEVDGEVYMFAYFFTSWNLYLVKINDDNIEHLIQPMSPIYETFKDNYLNAIFAANGELWLNCRNGMYVYKDGEFVWPETIYSIDNERTFERLYHDNKLYYIANGELLCHDFEEDETTRSYIDPVNHESVTKIFKTSQEIYFKIDEKLYTYDEEEKIFKLYMNGEFNADYIFETTDNKTIMLSYGKVYIEEDGQSQVIGDPEIISNRYKSVCIDKKNNAFLFLAQYQNKYFVSKYDGLKWEHFNTGITDREYQSNVMTPDIRMNCDSEGICYIGADHLLYSWDYQTNERLSMLNSTNMYDEEYYNVICTDSLGYVWISATLSTQASFKNVIAKFKDKEYDIVYEYTGSNWVHYFYSGVCLSNGDVVVKCRDPKLFRFSNNDVETIAITDCDDSEMFNENYTITSNTENEFVLSFGRFTGYSSNYGPFDLNGGVKVYKDGQWEETYNSMFAENEIEYEDLRFLKDKNNNQFVLARNTLYRVLANNDIEKYEISDFSQDFSSDLAQMGRKVFATTKENGLYYFELPEINSIDSEKKESNILISNYINDNKLRFKEDIKSYVIYSIDGKKLLSGTNTKEVNVNNFSNAVYFIVYETYNKQYAEKFMLNR